ncbi:MAG: GDP-mannose 4,6 dehydratase [Frankiales bacterium]|nr:GDP-mannose 4,6 dehydratase [Frankiales bacterium]
MSPSALITGITGQDGSYLAERLVDEGYAVHGLVHPGDSTVPDLVGRCPGAVLHHGDLTDDASLAAVVAAADPDEVYNLAGISSVAFSWEQPVLTADVTALGAARLLEQVWRRQQPVRFVQASSAEIFGDAVEAPQNETTPIRPNTPYGAAKAYAHQLVGVYRGRGMHAVSAILYNHESPRRPPTFVTRKITRTAARISLGLEQELVLGNLDARRDWGWAPDYVDAMVRAARATEADDYVIATGEAHSVQDFVVAAFRRAGIEDSSRYVRTDPEFVRPADAALQIGDATRARSRLGWAPTVSFEELVGRMVDADLRTARD